MERLGLRADRADVIVPAAVVYERVAELTGTPEIVVPRVGIKDGILLDLVDDLHDHRGHMDRRDREFHAAAIALGRRYRFDEGHARKVAELSLALFDGLAELHRMGPDERRVLLAGALLHDIGQFLSYRRHHKHSQYLISNSELPDLSPTQIALVGFVARYHRRSEPRATHPEFQTLDQPSQDVVRKLAAILRVADALDREHVARVDAIHSRVERDAVILEVQARGSLELEEWALRKKGRMFEDTYGRPLRLEPHAEVE
jgi:exopolyphosphatase / guanosine-5'-triphosphate,3'-diphosphate pyrophosphatase